MSLMTDMAKTIRRNQIATENRIDSTEDMLYVVFKGFDYSTGGERMYRQLLAVPYEYFDEWDGDTSRQYQKGDVVRTGEMKWLCQNNGVINPNPLESGLTKLFRSPDNQDSDGTDREWIREEFCIKDMERLYNGTWYSVKSSSVDSATPPPNDTASWEAI